jgi:hypothetical protein
MLFGFVRRGGKNGAKAVCRFGEPRIYVIGRLLIVGMDGVVAQNRQTDPERIIVDNPCLNVERKQVRGEMHDALCCFSRYVARNFQHSSNEISDR